MKDPNKKLLEKYSKYLAESPTLQTILAGPTSTRHSFINTAFDKALQSIKDNDIEMARSYLFSGEVLVKNGEILATRMASALYGRICAARDKFTLSFVYSAKGIDENCTNSSSQKINKICESTIDSIIDKLPKAIQTKHMQKKK